VERLEQPPLKIEDLRRAWVAGPWQRHAERHDLRRLESEVRVQHAPETAQQQAGSHQQHQRQGGLHDDERLAPAMARAIDGRAAPTVPEVRERA
jgi:hypothetical protein